MATIDQTLGLDPASLREWADRFLDAWNELDAHGVAALCTEDVVWTDPTAPEPFTGRDGVRRFVQGTARAFPDLQIVETAPPCFVGPSTVLSPYRMTGTMLGSLDVFAPTARKISIAGIDQWTFRDELLSSYCTFYDTMNAARQLGIMPASGSHAELLISGLQHLHAPLQPRTA